MKHDTPSFEEDHISQVPALQLLQNLGYTYLTQEEALTLRGGRMSAVLMEEVLAQQLRRINRIRFKGSEYPFSEGNILSAIQTLKDVLFDGLIRTNEKIYDLLCLGKSLPQTIDGNTKSFSLKYIDWDHPENNAFHVTEEFAVERTGTRDTFRVDIVLFVNGIPLGVIECKRPELKDPIGQAISQHIRNQKDNGIPKLFVFSQLLLAISKNEAKYATTGTAGKFWSVWKEQNIDDKALGNLVNKPLSTEAKDKLFGSRFRYVRRYFDDLEAQHREITAQDRAINSLCRPVRLLELTYGFLLFDAGVKKIARYQQYFCVSKILQRITNYKGEGSRSGGVVWHTQGSGKSLTMVMLAKALARNAHIPNFRIVLVTDRVDLDDQLNKTFTHCGCEPEQAKTGSHLAKMLGTDKAQIITTVIDKFDAAVGPGAVKNPSPNIFVLVDEGHRGQYGELHAKMRRAMPNGCFIGFTGTPIMKKEKHTVSKFGGLIDVYNISQAVEDKAVVPLLYEGRHVDQKVDSESMDAWFLRVTEGLSDAQKVDLKKKFATTDQLNITEQKVMRVAYDISVHYRDNWKGTPYKAQLVTQSKSAAMLYQKYLKQFDMVTSEVLISPPDDREGNEDLHEENADEVVRFWENMMDRFGNEKEYNRQIINSFKNDDHPEIIVVVDKLLTGFDAPRNTILYLTRLLKDHTLLQAIARVNRLYEGKDFGYIIDYRGVLKHLDEALEVYGNLGEFDQEDLIGTLTDVSAEIKKLPQRYSDVWELFKSIKNKRDEEAYERLLADEEVRAKFYERLSAYARTLAIALASAAFAETTPAEQCEKYKRDLKFFMHLRTSVRKRYAEVVDFKEYEKRIQKLLDTYVGTGEVESVTGLVNIFDANAFAKEVDALGSPSSKADTIAYRTKKTIHEHMDEDPAFYKKFSALLEEVIKAFRAQRLADADYLRKVTEIQDSVRNRGAADVPQALVGRDAAKAYYGVLDEILGAKGGASVVRDQCAAAGLHIEDLINKRKIVNWTTNQDVQNQMKNDLEDCLHELKDKDGIDITYEDMDRILELCIDIARARERGGELN